MRPFSYQRLLQPRDVTALHNVSSRDAYIAGGTTLLDLMKLDVIRPERVIDLNALSQSPDFGGIEVADGGLYLGALVRMADAADHEQIRGNYPVISQTLNLAASQQIRNMASLGGNGCNALGAHTFATRAGMLATSARLVPAAPPLAASTVCMPCWVRAKIALQPIRATSPKL
jgi:CO/xanthine dehydrogenase FAD-binding subunit